MAEEDHELNAMPSWCWLAPLAAAMLLAAWFAHVISPSSGFVIALAIVLLGGAVFAAVHHAEVVAAKVGQPFGSILLALSVTALEVGLIVSVMTSGSTGTSSIARDTVYSAVMIVLNGIVGICLVSGALRHYEQEFRLQGATSILSVIATLAVISLVLPNFTLTTPGPTYASSQLLFVGGVSLVLYILFAFVQTVRHRQDFLMGDSTADDGERPSAVAAILAGLLLVISLVVVILLAEILSPVLERAVLTVGLPPAVVGLVIAAVVLLPEGVTAMKAANRNRLQSSLNASLGSVAASAGLTVPIVGATAVYLGQPLELGLGPKSMVLLMLTLFVSTLTFATGRTTVLQGGVHLVIFGVFIFLSAVP